MKNKIFAAMCAALCALALTGCGVKNDPESVVKAFHKALYDGDGEAAWALTYVAETDKPEKVEEHKDLTIFTAENFIEQEKDPQCPTLKNFEVTSCELSEDGNEARVWFSETFSIPIQNGKTIEHTDKGKYLLKKDGDGKWKVQYP